MADGRHFENSFITISHRGSSDFNEIWCAAADLGYKAVTWQSIKILQIQNGGRRRIKNRFWALAISQRIVVRLTRNLIRRSRITFRYKSRDQNTKIWKFKMADDHHLENGFIAISQLRIIRFQWNSVCCCIILFQERSHVTVSKFCKCKMAASRFVCERLYVGLQIWWVFWVNRWCPPMLIVIQG